MRGHAERRCVASAVAVVRMSAGAPERDYMRYLDIARRATARLLVPVLLGGAAISVAVPPTAASGAENPITVENQQPGSKGWQINQESSDDVAKQIKGYASATSVNVGGSIDFFVTVNPVQTYSIDIYRIGYYQGMGGRMMLHVGSQSGVQQPDCPMDSNTGMISCQWATSYTLDVPSTWTSGIYLAKLTNAQLFQNYITSVVRDDARTSDLLYQQSVTTYQAYNNYPDDATSPSGRPVTGKSLYEGSSSSVVTGQGTTRAVKVSFDRPYANDDGSGDFLDWEIYYVRWMEQSGYDVSYSTDIDTHTDGARLRSHKAFVSVGHDEYWSKAMYDAATAARDAGTGLGFFGGNDVYWQIRLEQSSSGAPNRVQVCYKDANLDPVKGPTTTVRWRDSQLNRPEQRLIGVQFTSQQPDGAPLAGFVAGNTSNFLYGGTGITDGTRIPGIVGYEADKSTPGVALPTAVPGTYTLLSSSPYTNSSGATDTQNSVVYQAASGAWVFGAGTIGWSLGLYNDSASQRADPRMQALTTNVLNQLISPVTPPPVAPSDLSASPSDSSTVSLSWTDNSSAEDTFLLTRSTTQTFSSPVTITLPANTTSYSDTGLAPGVYYYRLQASGSGGSSPFTDTSAAATTSYLSLVQGRSALMSYWRLGEASGPTAIDTAGTADGTYLNGVTLGSAGAVVHDPDTAVLMNGTTNKISLPSIATVTDFTIEGWTNLATGASSNPNGNNAVYGTLNNVRLLARPGTPGTATMAYAGVWLGGTEYSLQPTSTASNIGSWVHWAVTRSGATLTLYRNGVQVAQRTDLPAAATANISGWIGAQGGSAYFLNGRVDDVAVYNQALTANQVSDNYAAGVNGVAPVDPSAGVYRDTVLSTGSLLSYWRLGEASGATATDSRGTNNGTYLNGTVLGSGGAVTNDPNTSATFNGTTSKVSLPTLAPVTNFSIEGWTNLAPGAVAGSGNNTVFGSNGNVRLLARPGKPDSPTTAYAGVWLGGTEYVLQPNSTQSNLGSWVHWVMTRSAGTLTLYRNGVRIGLRSDLPATATANITGWIGAQTGNAYFLNGRLDEVAVYSSALSATAVADHYRAALSGPAPAP
jgi:hypothetical protein